MPIVTNELNFQIIPISDAVETFYLHLNHRRIFNRIYRFQSYLLHFLYTRNARKLKPQQTAGRFSA